MFIRFLLGSLFILGVSGCATTGNKADAHDQLQSRVVELEKKLEEKDSEIVDLQYEVKDLSSKVETNSTKTTSAFTMEATAPTVVTAKGGNEIIRVNATPEQLQTALQGAGLYTGKIDGKIGAGTKAAVKEFQKSHELTADGVVGRKTWDALKAYLK